MKTTEKDGNGEDKGDDDEVDDDVDDDDNDEEEAEKARTPRDFRRRRTGDDNEGVELSKASSLSSRCCRRD